MCNIFNMCIYIWPSFHFSSALWRLLIVSQLGCNLIRCNSLCFFFITSHFAFETVLCLFSLMFKCAACNQLRQINHCRESERQFYQKQNFIRIETTATTCRTTIANCLLASSSSRYFSDILSGETRAFSVRSSRNGIPNNIEQNWRRS